MTTQILPIALRRFEVDLIKVRAAEAQIIIPSIPQTRALDSVLPIVLSLTFLLIFVMVGLGITLWAYRAVDSETVLLQQYDSEPSFSSCQSTKLLTSETMLLQQYDSETVVSSD